MLLLPLPATAQQAEEDPIRVPRAGDKKKPPPVSMEVHVGQANQARVDRVVPVRVVLDNNGPAVTGTLQLRDLRGSFSEMPVELPRRAHKEYTLFAPLSQDESHPQYASGSVALVAQGGGLFGRKTLAEKLLVPKYEDDIMLVLSASGEAAGLDFLSQPRRFGDFQNETRRVQSVQYSVQDLPRQWPGYEPAEVVVLNGRAWTGMDDAQKRAFRTWVEQGGKAILGGESTMEWRDPEGQALAGVVPRELVSAPQLGSLAAWGGSPFRTAAGGLLTVSGPLAPGANVLLRNGERPLVVARPALLGSVLWLGFDPFRATLRSWNGYEKFWRRALEEVRKAPTAPTLSMPAEVQEARTAASALPRLPAPPLSAVIVFGVVYAIIFGPVNVVLLRRMRRTVRSWLVMPSLALAMLFLVVVAGQAWGNARIVLNSVSILQAEAGSRSAMEHALIGLFSPTNRAFDLATDDPAPQLTDQGGADPRDGDARLRLGWPQLQADALVRWDAVPLQLFSTRLLNLRRPRDLGGTLEATAPAGGARGPAAPVTLRNGTSMGLRRAYLAWGNLRQPLGDLAPGQQVTAKPDGWTRELKADVATAEGALENQRFQAALEQLRRQTPSTLIPVEQRVALWLVAECADYKGGLDVLNVPYNNRGGLFLARLTLATEGAR